MRGGDLLSRIQKRKYFSEKDAAAVFRKILSAVAWLHRSGVVHRDLKVYLP
jgi:serine/threonine protein kinase